MPEPVTMTTLAIAAGAIAGTKFVETLIEGISKKLGGSIESWWRSKPARTHAKILFRRISSLQNVKTIWQIDKEVDLNEFYFPTKLAYSKGNRFAAHDLNSLPNFQNLILEGTVGYGKTIFLRYLGANELKAGSSLPLFIQLRFKKAHISLSDLLLDRLERWGFPRSIELLNGLLSSGKASMLCDGFDEVEEESQGPLVDELESYAEKHPDARIIVTSRPDNPIQRSPHFRVVKLTKIEPGELPGFISKLEPDKQEAQNLIRELSEENSFNIRETLVTPLLVTLLVVSYRANRRVPQTVNEFYQKLFDTLLSRHDGTKPGFRRERRSGLTDEAIKNAFEAFCFFSRNDRLKVFNAEAAAKASGSACKYIRATCEPMTFLDDIVNITSLLLKEGNELHFIHQSVQEYFAASFLKQLGDPKATEFYSTCLGTDPNLWKVELDFLSVIDRWRWLKHFQIPALNAVLMTVWKKIPLKTKPLSKASVTRLLGLVFVPDKHLVHPDLQLHTKEIVLTFSPALSWLDASRGPDETSFMDILANAIIDSDETGEVAYYVYPARPSECELLTPFSKSQFKNIDFFADESMSQSLQDFVDTILLQKIKLCEELETHEKDEQALSFGRIEMS